MTNLTKPRARKGCGQTLSVRIIRTLLSWKSRRMIFLSTIYGLATDLQQPDLARTKQLTKALNIARTSGAIQLPLAIKSVIWHRHLPTDVEFEGEKIQVTDMTRSDLTKGSRDAMIDELLMKAPAWLLYARTSQMRYDLERMFKVLQTPKMA